MFINNKPLNIFANQLQNHSHLKVMRLTHQTGKNIKTAALF